MKNFSADLLALLASGVPIDYRDLITIGPTLNGQTMYIATGSLPVPFGANTFEPTQFGVWKRGKIESKIGLESSACDLTVMSDNGAFSAQFPGTSALLIDGIKFGLLGNANVTIERMYNSSYMSGYAFPATTGPTGGSLLEVKFAGQVADLSQIGLTKATVTVQDYLYLLNIPVPRRLIQPSCSHTLYDVACTMVKANFTVSGAVASTETSSIFTTAAALNAVTGAGTFAQGVLTWKTGANAGLSYTVRAWTPGISSATVQLDVAPIFPIADGDTFSVAQGCNKTVTACVDFQGATAAMVHYGGQPNTPVPETAVGGA